MSRKPKYKEKARGLSLTDAAPSSPTISRSMSEVKLEVESEADAAKRARCNEFLYHKSKLLQFAKLQDSDFQKLTFLGDGISGSVHKVRHKPTGLVMARKLIYQEFKPEVQKNISRELRVLHTCSSQFIVGFYGSFFHNGVIHILMEYMDVGALDGVLARVGRIPEDIVAEVGHKVVEGLLYLQEKLHVIHRDVKPSNILVNTSGDVKLCDFGVSGELNNSLAQTFIGTKSYMAPERLKGEPYRVESDVWSLGISLIELATGHFPIPATNLEKPLVPIKLPKSGSPLNPPLERQNMAVFELLSHIVDHTPPQINPEHGFSENFGNFIHVCLKRTPDHRMPLRDLIVHPWLIMNEKPTSELAAYFQSTLPPDVLLERIKERASSPQLSASSQESTPIEGNHHALS